MILFIFLMTLPRAQIAVGGGGEVSRTLIWKLKNVSWFLGKKCSDCVYLWVKFLIWICFLRAYSRKIPIFLRAWLFFFMLGIKYLSKCPYSKKVSLPWKIPGGASDCEVLLLVLFSSLFSLYIQYYGKSSIWFTLFKINSYFIICERRQNSKNEKIKSISKILLNYLFIQW